MNRGIRQRKRAFWKDLVQQWAASGQSKAAFARQHGVTPQQLSQWAVRYPEWVVAATEAKVEHSPSKPAVGTQRFLTVRTVEDDPDPADLSPQPGGPVVVTLSHGRRLELYPGFCAQTLQRAMEVLEA
ncbi:helix-turn-helix domain-containing protein [Ectothiorhodospira sp. BSL-9]|uniref:IS66 family insertion sequence element accessory protein TnpA n=1 Tax=Ectothiorhodospira sp. BSL-9 TaxID=1442136 RepID=UPI0007B42963|nr:helix-turn-helix domain-containing protein [Ectothiorhodospira sp. BSL-9]ANB01983.1 hypothetical protein ECTOBSL9_1237 [Ectothiorhodospira sp. BSL-9]